MSGIFTHCEEKRDIWRERWNAAHEDVYYQVRWQFGGEGSPGGTNYAANYNVQNNVVLNSTRVVSFLCDFLSWLSG
jgi:hypothetical protein